MKKFLKIIVAFLALTLFLSGCSKEKSIIYNRHLYEDEDLYVILYYNNKNYVTELVVEYRMHGDERSLGEVEFVSKEIILKYFGPNNKDVVLKSEIKDNIVTVGCSVKVSDNTREGIKRMLHTEVMFRGRKTNIFDDTKTNILVDKVEKLCEEEHMTKIKEE